MIETAAFQRRLQVRRASGALFAVLCLGATLAGIAVLAVLLITVAGDGLTRLSWDFVNSFPSRHPEEAGIKAALYGTLWLMALYRALRRAARHRRGHLPGGVRAAQLGYAHHRDEHQ